MIAASKNNENIKHILNFYDIEIWNTDFYTIPCVIKYCFKKFGQENIIIYPKEYFYPFYYNELFHYKCIEENTYGIHWWTGSWIDKIEICTFLKTKHIKIR